jgi:hypothetical protein
VLVPLAFGSLAIDSNAMYLPSRLIRRPKLKTTAVAKESGDGVAVGDADGVALGKPSLVLVTCRKPLTVEPLKLATYISALLKPPPSSLFEVRFALDMKVRTEPLPLKAGFELAIGLLSEVDVVFVT